MLSDSIFTLWERMDSAERVGVKYVFVVSEMWEKSLFLLPSWNLQLMLEPTRARRSWREFFKKSLIAKPNSACDVNHSQKMLNIFIKVFYIVRGMRLLNALCVKCVFVASGNRVSETVLYTVLCNWWNPTQTAKTHTNSTLPQAHSLTRTLKMHPWLWL